MTVPLIESFPQMKYEEMEANDNMSTVIQFALLGFSDLPNLQGLLFGVFTITYTIILIGNGLLVIITWLDPALQKPMYFFLANFPPWKSVTCPSLSLGSWWTSGLRTGAFLCCPVLPKCASSLYWQLLSASSWRCWPMTAAWPSVTPCTIPWSWPQRRASSWLWAPGSVESQCRYGKRAKFFLWVSVTRTRLTTSSVTCPPFWSWPAETLLCKSWQSMQ